MATTISVNYVLCIIIGLCVPFTSRSQSKEDRQHEWWDFTHVDYRNIQLPYNFSLGAGVAAYQVDGASGCPDSNWAHHESLFNLEPSGNACDFRNTCFDDIALIKNLGLTAFRFSVDWSIIEPIKGVYNHDALKHYELFCQKLCEQGISPVVTLHHFSHPQWFEELGAFEKYENVAYFVAFAKLVFNHLGSYVSLWCTINEPSIYVFGGYIRAQSPPGKGFPPAICDFKKAGAVMGNLLKAHVAVYKALKALPGGDKASIGIVHQMMPFKSFHTGILQRTMETCVASVLNRILNDAVIHFFKTGEYRFDFPHRSLTMFSWIPRFVGSTSFHSHEAPATLDFFGINYYSHILISINLDGSFSEGYRPDDIKTDMPFGFYPEGIYHVIAQASVLGVPLYITENGIADAKDDRRALWIERHLYAVSKAIEDGYDVRGFFYWSLIDNYEWDLGYGPKFGLYHVDRTTQKRTLRQGSRVLEYIAKNALNTDSLVPVSTNLLR